MIIGKIEENWMENNLFKQRKIGAILRFLKIKIFFVFDFKKINFLLLVFVGQLKMVNKIKENSVDNCQKDRKLKEEQFIQTKKNWCTTMVSQNKDFLIF